MLKFNYQPNSRTTSLYAGAAVLIILSFQSYWLYSGYGARKKQLEEELITDLREYALKNDFREILGVTNQGVTLSLSPEMVSEEARGLPIRKFEVGVTIVWDESAALQKDMVQGMLSTMLGAYQTPEGRAAANRDFIATITDKYPELELSLESKINGKTTLYRQREGSPWKLTVISDLNPKNAYSLLLYNAETVIIMKMGWLFIISLLYLSMCLGAVHILQRSIRRNRLLIESKDNFTSNMTHELKTPLSTLSAAAEALDKYNFIEDKAVARDYLNLMINDINKLDRLTTDILMNARLNRNELALDRQKANLMDLVAQGLENYRALAQKLGATLSAEIDPAIEVYADRLHLSNVLSNLIDNALKYNSGQPSITIYARTNEDSVSIFIKDNGIGIKATYHEEIFKPYFRIHTGSLHAVRGFGIGLTYAAEIMRLHKGSLRLVYSAKGVGSEFEIQLPLQK